MKKIITALTLLLSMSSLASTHFMMYSDVETMYGAMTAGESMMQGSFTSANQEYGVCKGGTYTVMPGETMTINISFPGEPSPCTLMGMTISMSPQDYPRLMSGEAVDVSFSSPRYFEATHQAKIQIVNVSP